MRLQDERSDGVTGKTGFSEPESGVGRTGESHEADDLLKGESADSIRARG